jgi:uncharacterized membrane protein
MGDLERTVGRLLSVGTVASVGLLGVGVVLMLGAGQSPLDPAYPRLEPTRLLEDVAGLRPSGFLWLGLLAAVATPAGRVVASLVGYVRSREWAMVGISLAVLVVIGASVVLGGALEA